MIAPRWLRCSRRAAAAASPVDGEGATATPAATSGEAQESSDAGADAPAAAEAKAAAEKAAQEKEEAEAEAKAAAEKAAQEKEKAEAEAEAALDAELAALVKVASCKVTRAMDKKEAPAEGSSPGKEKAFTAYVIECTAVAGEEDTAPASTWEVARRFSEFDQLSNDLMAEGLGAVKNFALPSKFNAPWKSKESIESERATTLCAWIEAVLLAVNDAQPAEGDDPLTFIANKTALKIWLQFLQPDGSAVDSTPVPEPEAEPEAAAVAAAEPAPQPASGASTQEEKKEEEAIAVMTVVKKSQIRSGFEMDSDKAGVAKKGDEVLVFEERTNEKGTVRVRPTLQTS
eukprot:COSAG01_NODE_9907_length_2295_cov_2.401361_1_plen_344_part_00